MRNRKTLPEINAGSTADIAFLLLIFFLVTTTFPNEQGIVRKLPKPCLSGDCSIPLKERNLLRISINEKGDYLLGEKLTPFGELTTSIKSFLDNNGDGSCTYCLGAGDPEASENPAKAVIVVSSHRNTKYEDYINLQSKLSTAYFELREQFSLSNFKKPLSKLNPDEWEKVKEAYPLLLSEAALQ